MSRAAALARRLRTGTADLVGMLRDYFGIGSLVRQKPIADGAALRQFLESRASFLAQTSLYGYLRTRAGMKYPALFDDDAFVVSIDIAKWHMWLACLSDLTVYAGGLVARRSPMPHSRLDALMKSLLDAILDDTGHPQGADDEFPAHAERVRERIRATRWHTVSDDGECFTESPDALVRWAPVVENLKRLDEEIVRNSVRFHWQEIRRDLRKYLDAEALARSIEAG